MKRIKPLVFGFNKEGMNMKKLLLVTLLLSSSMTFASEVYHCEFLGPNFDLTFHDDDSITLSNKTKKFQCEFGTENFPGTEVELTKLNCQSGAQKKSFYYSEMNSKIYLSTGFVLSNDVECSLVTR